MARDSSSLKTRTAGIVASPSDQWDACQFRDNSVMQLLIPYAHVNDAACAQVAPLLQLPHLEQVLRAMTLVQTLSGTAQDLSPPHELFLASALGLSPSSGHIPWAALDRVRSGEPADNTAHAWLTPAFWEIVVGRILMRDPGALVLK